MKNESALIDNSNFYSCVVQGVIAWMAYAVFEGLFIVIMPWFTNPHYEYCPLHWGFTTLLFPLYSIIGVVLASLVWLSRYVVSGKIQYHKDVKSNILYPSITTFTVVLAFIINLFFHVAPSATDFKFLVPLFASSILIVSLILSSISHVWFKRLFFFTNPMTACFLLLGIPWLIFNVLKNQTRVYKSLGLLIFMVVICLISFLVIKVTESRQLKGALVAGRSSHTKPFLFLVPMLIVVIGFNFFLEQKTIQVAHKSKSLLSSAENPNVILISMDTVRADHLSLHGYERDTTPNLKKFSETATLYTNAIASGDMTLPTHASIFTGLYARSHGAHLSKSDPAGRAMANEFNTLAEILLEKGYFTEGVVANSGYLTHHFGMDQGFRYYNQAIAVSFFGKHSAIKPYLLRKCMRDFLAPFFSRVHSESINRTAEDINREVFTLLDNKKETKSAFFLFINYMDAHNPYIPPPPFDTLFPGKDPTFTLDRYCTIAENVFSLKKKVSEKDHTHLLSQYDGGIAYIDFHIGKLIEKLKKLKLYDNCIIIITSDHGEVFGERDLFNHAVSVYQDQIYVPLVIKYPKSDEGVIVNETVSVVDLMPTIFDVLKHEIPEGLHGKSLLKEDIGESREIISESFPREHSRTTHSRFNRIERAIISWPYKYIESTVGKKELYDLSKDPKEAANIYNETDIVSRDLAERLSNWLRVTKPKIASDDKRKLNDDALKRLKALGYIQ